MIADKPTQTAASITYDRQPIQCGDHPLKAHVTFTRREHARAVDGYPMRYAEPPDIIIRCTTCGREAHTDRFVIDNTYIEHSWPL